MRWASTIHLSASIWQALVVTLAERGEQLVAVGSTRNLYSGKTMWSEECRQVMNLKDEEFEGCRI